MPNVTIDVACDVACDVVTFIRGAKTTVTEKRTVRVAVIGQGDVITVAALRDFLRQRRST